MADRQGLRLVGWAYGALAAVVAVTAFVVVSAHINGKVQARPGADAQFARLP